MSANSWSDLFSKVRTVRMRDAPSVIAIKNEPVARNALAMKDVVGRADVITCAMSYIQFSVRFDVRLSVGSYMNAATSFVYHPILQPRCASTAWHDEWL